MAKKQPEPIRKGSQYRLFNWFNRLLPLDRYFTEAPKNSPNDTRIPKQYFNYLLWIILLLIVQGRIGYFDEVNARQTVLLSQRAENMRAEYTTLVAENMKSGKQSVIQSKILADSIMERKAPPIKIVVSKAELEDK
jgi:hypothetical protein